MATTRSNNPCEKIFASVTLLVSIIAEIRLFLVSSSLIKTLTSSWNIAQVSKDIEMWQLRSHSSRGQEGISFIILVSREEPGNEDAALCQILKW